MEIKNSLVKKTSGTFSTFITGAAVKSKVMNMVGDKDGARFISSIISAVSANPQLSDCDFNSVLSCAMLGEGLKLSPSPQLGQYYMVPFNDKNHGKIATFILGYKGYIQLAIRSGYYKKLNVLEIREGELVKYDKLNEEILVNMIEDDEERDKKQTVGYYAMFEYQNGFRKALYWPKKKMEAHAMEYSAGYRSDKMKGSNYTFWSKDFDGQALKTMIRQLISKWGIMSIEMQNAIEADVEPVPEYRENKDSGDDFFTAEAEAGIATTESLR